MKLLANPKQTSIYRPALCKRRFFYLYIYQVVTMIVIFPFSSDEKMQVVEK